MKTNLTSSLASALVIAGIISSTVLPAQAQIAYPATPSGETERGVIGDYVYQLRQQAYPNTTNGVLEIGTLNPTMVGIGTNSPVRKLEVNNGSIRIQRDDISSPTLELFSSTGSNWQIQSIVNGGRFNIRNANNNTNDFSINTDGHVGIGTITPNAQLEVVGDPLVDGSLTTVQRVTSPGSCLGLSDFGASIDILAGGQAARIGAKRDTCSTGVGLSLYTTSSTGSELEALSILEDGTVGIGTMTPSSGGDQNLKLDIEGPFGATHICDENGNNCTTPASISALASGAAPKFVDGDNTSDAVYTAGNVGIGTTSPAHLFHVVSPTGDFRIRDEDIGTQTRVIAEVSGQNGRASLQAVGTNQASNTDGAIAEMGLKLDYNDTPINDGTADQVTGWYTNFRKDSFGSGTPGSYLIYRDSTQSTTYTDFTSGSEWAFALKPNLDAAFNGNVGIGTTDPVEALEVDNGRVQAAGFVGKNYENYTVAGHAHATTRAITPTDNFLGAFGFINTKVDEDDPEGYFFVALDELNDEINNNSDRHFVVRHNGNVGIGTTEPNTKLMVAGDDPITKISDNEGTNRYAALQLETLGGAWKLETDSHFQIDYNGTDLLYIDRSTGNVGIGTSTPNAKLDVIGRVRSTDFSGFQSLRPSAITEANQSVGGYNFGTTGKPSAARIFGLSNASSTDADPQLDIQFWIDQNNDSINDTSERVLHLGYDGLIGIGTILPSAKLHVNGNIKVAEDNTTCTATNGGEIRYEAATGIFFGCNGTTNTWDQLN